MTTMVTLTTHDWPVDVTTTDSYGRIYHAEMTTVAPHTTASFCVTNTRTIQFAELEKPSFPVAKPEAGPAS